MDWERLSGASEWLVETLLGLHDGATSVDHLMNLAINIDPARASDGSQYRLIYQAIDLLERQSIVTRDPNGTVRLREEARALRGVPAGSWMPDPDSPEISEWIEMEELVETADLSRPLGGALNLSRLRVEDWRQFREIDVVFHPRLTILTGANAAGKTTLLNLLAPHFNWQGQYVIRGPHLKVAPTVDELTIGELRYSNGGRTRIYEPPVRGVTMSQASYSAMQPVPGIFISSHRSVSSYRPMDSLPARFSAADTLLAQFASEVQVRYAGGTSQFPPLYRMKEALVSAALHGYGNEVVRPTESAIRIWEGFQEVLRKFLPLGLGFQGLKVENGDLFLATESGEFPLEAASGGLSAMLELSWQIFLRSQEAESFTVCIDEPENHLHPELQRLIVPSLLDAFPRVSFIVATHSPFVVTATPDCAVYALGRVDGEERVRSRQIGDTNASGTADETLQTVLGLDTPLPIWVQSALSEAIEEMPLDATAEDLRRLRSRLSEIGLERQFPAAIAAISEARLD